LFYIYMYIYCDIIMAIHVCLLLSLNLGTFNFGVFQYDFFPINLNSDTVNSDTSYVVTILICTFRMITSIWPYVRTSHTCTGYICAVNFSCNIFLSKTITSRTLIFCRNVPWIILFLRDP
jgi:hypothetical protein